MTAARYVLDTNICIYIQRQRPPQVLLHFNRLKPGEAAISIVTWGELVYGAEKSTRRAEALRNLEDLRATIQVLPMMAEIGPIYGQIRAALERKGQLIGTNDLWIAAQAKAENLTLVTNNEREFRRIPGLKVQNWAA